MSEDPEPKWISMEQVLRIHDKTIELQGGLSGMRDSGLLESALARPEHHYAYGEQDMFLLASSYAEGIARNHPFADGNKRTAYETADFFLYQNGYDFGVKDVKEQTAFFENFAAGNVSREELAEFYRENSRERKSLEYPKQSDKDDMRTMSTDENDHSNDGNDSSR